MRLIKFRGRDDSRKWHFGSLLTNNTDWAFITDTLPNNEVQPKTVGQFTGVYDCNGKEIYEGDILKINGYPKSALFIVEYVGTAFIAKCTNQNFRNYPLDHFISGCKIETIGNVFDNPELLEGGANDD